MWLQQLEAGFAIASGVALVVVGILKCADRSSPGPRANISSNFSGNRTRARLIEQLGQRTLDVVDRLHRLLGLVEFTFGAAALGCFAQSWFLAGGVILTSAGTIFLVLTLLRFRLQPDQGCGCVKRASAENGFAVSSLIRATLILAGGVSGLCQPAASSYSAAAAVGWLGLVALSSPELWHATKWRCGRPLLFGQYDEELKMRRTREYRRLQRMSVIDLNSQDYWRQGCDAFFSYALKGPDIEEGMFVVFMLSATGVTSRITSVNAAPTQPIHASRPGASLPGPSHT